MLSLSGKIGKPTLKISMANIGNLQRPGHSSNHCTTGEGRWMRPRIQPWASDRVPNDHPSNDPTTLPGNSSLAGPLAEPSHLGELTIKPGLKYSLYSWLSNSSNTGNCTYQEHTPLTYTCLSICTQVWVPCSTPHGPKHVTGLHSFFGNHTYSHTGSHVLGQYSEPQLKSTNADFQFPPNT